MKLHDKYNLDHKCVCRYEPVAQAEHVRWREDMPTGNYIFAEDTLRVTGIDYPSTYEADDENNRRQNLILVDGGL